MCSTQQVSLPVTVFNDGSAPASNVVVRFFAGDPQAGGSVLHEETIPGPIAPNMSAMLTVTIPNFPQSRSIRIFGVVNPDDTITECDNGNNTDDADSNALCIIF